MGSYVHLLFKSKVSFSRKNLKFLSHHPFHFRLHVKNIACNAYMFKLFMVKY
jgi:hypothetical protein